MISSFGDKDTRKIWEGERIRGLSQELQELARRKLRMLNNSQNLADLPAFKRYRYPSNQGFGNYKRQ